MPFSAAQATAGACRPSTSGKGFSPAAGDPARRYSTEASIPRVMGRSGENRVAEVPPIRPLSRHQATAEAYHAFSGTSVKPVSAAWAGTARARASAAQSAAFRMVCFMIPLSFL